MTQSLPLVSLARHGETAWSLSGQHTGLTDIPLTERGEHDAHRLGERLKGHHFAQVLTSPLQRAARTCALAGFGTTAEIDPDLVEWDYGQYEGRRSAEILAERPGWQLFRDGCPGGESPEQVGPGRTVWCTACERWRATCCCSRAGISCECSPPAGSASTREPADTSCSIPRA